MIPFFAIIKFTTKTTVPKNRMTQRRLIIFILHSMRNESWVKK